MTDAHQEGTSEQKTGSHHPHNELGTGTCQA